MHLSPSLWQDRVFSLPFCERFASSSLALWSLLRFAEETCCLQHSSSLALWSIADHGLTIASCDFMLESQFRQDSRKLRIRLEAIRRSSVAEEVNKLPWPHISVSQSIGQYIKWSPYNGSREPCSSRRWWPAQMSRMGLLNNNNNNNR